MGRHLAYLSIAIFSGQFLSLFMGFLPGRQSLVFTSAAIIALVTVLLLFLTHKWCWIR
jgi:hypothetical protein